MARVGWVAIAPLTSFLLGASAQLALAQPTQDVTLNVFPPEAQLRAYFPKSPGEGEGLANGGTFQTEVAEFPVRLSAPGYETKEVKVALRKRDEVAPGQWSFSYELRPEGAASSLRHQFRRHPARSWGLSLFLLSGVGSGFWMFRKKASQDAQRARAAHKIAEQQTAEVRQKLDEVDPNLVGRTIDSYEVLSLLGEGAYAKVYRVRHLEYQDEFAMKLLRPELLDKSVGERVEREMTIGRDLIHPNLVRTFGFGSFRDAPYLILELISGQTLDDRLSEGPLSPAQASRILEKLAKGLEYAHGKGVVHRDLKPANIFLSGEYEVKILDFGVAKILDTHQRLTLTGQALGTPHYMSPEQARGQAGVASDIYALGAIGFEMMTGSPPYDGETALEVLTAHTFAETPSARESAPQVPEAFDELLMTMMAKLPQQRPESMSVVLRRLEQVRA